MKVLLNNIVTKIVLASFMVLFTMSSQAIIPEVKCQNSHLELNEALLIDRLSCIENEIPLPYNKRVRGFIDYFMVRDREYTEGVLNAKDIYFPIFEEALARHNMPDEIKYLAIVESGLNPKAVSPAYAVGLWQFMNGTGRMYGLKADILVDDRMDPFLATEAACKYLKSLYGMFKDWPLALAAYNCGPGNVRKAIRRSGYKKDFWEVYRYLPRETRSYVPQFIAISYVMNYSEEHMLFPESTPAFPEFETVEINQNLSLKTFAKELGVELEELQLLNPQIKRDIVPMHRKNYSFRIPKYAAAYYSENEADILASSEKLDSKEIYWVAKVDQLSPFGKEKHYYRVQSGDVIGKIAERYKVRVSHIRQWNNLRSNTIRIGQRLVIWKAPGFSAPSRAQYVRNTKPQPIPSGKVYQVKYGDTLWDISRKFEGLSIEKIKKLNNLQNNTIKPGMVLRIG